MTTNRAEAMHLRVFKVMPKTKTCSRTFEGRAHCALHTDSVGIGNSVLALNEHSGSSLAKRSKAIAVLNRLQKRQEYFKSRQQSFHFKVRRNQLLHRALTKKRLSKLKTERVKGDIGRDHSY